VFIISSFSWLERSLQFTSVFDVVAMLVMCSIINDCTEWKLYTHKQCEHKKYINFAHRTLHIIETIVKQVQAKYMPLHTLFRIVYYTRISYVHLLICGGNECVQTEGVISSLYVGTNWRNGKLWFWRENIKCVKNSLCHEIFVLLRWKILLSRKTY
jgi:hypothetical protein